MCVIRHSIEWILRNMKEILGNFLARSLWFYGGAVISGNF